MQTSENGLNLLKLYEGCSSKVKGKNVILTPKDIENNVLVYPYYCSAKHLTIGYGNRIYDDNKNLKYSNNFENGITFNECLELFKASLTEYENMINKWLTCSIKQNQFDALVCFCYNTPAGAKRIIQDYINKNLDPKEKWSQFCKIKIVENGIENIVINKGLQTRREGELKLFYA